MSEENDILFAKWSRSPRISPIALFLALTLLGFLIKWLIETVPMFWGSDLVRLELVIIKDGTYTIGSPVTEEARIEDETQHQVTITRPFAIAMTEVTQQQYGRVMGKNPSSDKACGLSCPVTDVSWFDAISYLNELSQLDPAVEPCYRADSKPIEWIEGCTGYRLPTEAEWEIAARAGTLTRYAGTDDVTELCSYANGFFMECSDGYRGLAPVARFQPNSFFLYDMSGNVREWTWDGYREYQEGTRDPRGAQTGQYRVIRGGSYTEPSSLVRVSFRGNGKASQRDATLGFRVARSLP